MFFFFSQCYRLSMVIYFMCASCRAACGLSSLHSLPSFAAHYSTLYVVILSNKMCWLLPWRNVNQTTSACSLCFAVNCIDKTITRSYWEALNMAFKSLKYFILYRFLMLIIKIYIYMFKTQIHFGLVKFTRYLLLTLLSMRPSLKIEPGIIRFKSRLRLVMSPNEPECFF